MTLILLQYRFFKLYIHTIIKSYVIPIRFTYYYLNYENPAFDWPLIVGSTLRQRFTPSDFSTTVKHGVKIDVPCQKTRLTEKLLCKENERGRMKWWKRMTENNVPTRVWLQIWHNLSDYIFLNIQFFPLKTTNHPYYCRSDAFLNLINCDYGFER